jgi:hypothetical protein
MLIDLYLDQGHLQQRFATRRLGARHLSHAGRETLENWRLGDA